MGEEQLFPASNAFLESMPDEKLIDMALGNNTYALDEIISRYKSLVRSRARRYFLAGADSDDIIQEGMIGLFKAIRDFKVSRQNTFSSFAALCITRQILSAIKAATRKKHLPLNSFVSLSCQTDDEKQNAALSETISKKPADNPEELLLIKEQLSSVNKTISKEFSSFEKNVLSLYLGGYSYKDISAKLKTRTKSVDNALQRIKRKLSDRKDIY